MAFYIDHRAVNNLIGNEIDITKKKFTLEELSQYNGKNGKPSYVAIDDIVYDVSKVPSWMGGTHFELKAGNDLTKDFNACHISIKVLSEVPKVGMLDKGIIFTIREQQTFGFSPDDWIRYLTPIVYEGLEEANAGASNQYLFEKYMLIGVLIGQGRTPKEAVSQVKVWEDSGIADLLIQAKKKI